MDFKFVCREEELNYAREALLNNRLVIYYYLDDSGLSHYLKKICLELNKDEPCFYLDGSKMSSASIQIASQIVSDSEKKKDFGKNKSIVFRKIIETLASSIDIIPVVDVSNLLSGFSSALQSTIDVDMEHIADYKIEKALICMMKQIEEKEKINKIYFLIDDISSLKNDSIEFIAKLMTFNFVYFYLLSHLLILILA